MKRRVSVAIAMVSDPKIIYFDEPSTGLDPENRRQLWDILAAAKGKRAMVLTTHYMEEADVLCNRIAIVNNGILRCIAPQVRLKTLYGGGYHLEVNSQKEMFFKLKRSMAKRSIRKETRKNQQEQENMGDVKEHPSQMTQKMNNQRSSNVHEELSRPISQVHDDIRNFVRKLIPNSELIKEFNGNFTYIIPKSKAFKPSKIFIEFEKHKERLYIQDWGLYQSSLEDVFTKICEQNGDNNA